MRSKKVKRRSKNKKRSGGSDSGPFFVGCFWHRDSLTEPRIDNRFSVGHISGVSVRFCQVGARKLGVYSGSAVALSGGTFGFEPLHHVNLAAEFPLNLSG